MRLHYIEDSSMNNRKNRKITVRLSLLYLILVIIWIAIVTSIKYDILFLSDSTLTYNFLSMYLTLLVFFLPLVVAFLVATSNIKIHN